MNEVLEDIIDDVFKIIKENIELQNALLKIVKKLDDLVDNINKEYKK